MFVEQKTQKKSGKWRKAEKGEHERDRKGDTERE